MAALQPYHTTELSTHLHYLTQCLALAAYSPPKPTNFRVGAILLLRRYFPPTLGTTPDQQTTFEDKILSTGYTLEHRGNTHAEQCCLSKYASHHGVPEEDVGIPLQKERGDNPNAKILMAGHGPGRVNRTQSKDNAPLPLLNPVSNSKDQDEIKTPGTATPVSTPVSQVNIHGRISKVADPPAIAESTLALEEQPTTDHNLDPRDSIEVCLVD
ncbi:hypothetical protein CISG_01568 [Coccidioides immitis RMSCC 3703]|uniref:Uncharacterized protein n=1 Tax=Coccidioides immitis RMSCC 3703 TaxID=454286 RepID=A0A0J8TVC1_COCIT|nr:hypothetical protein CISG_01568 [Coccidioides immitis RMSCC 3703]